MISSFTAGSLLLGLALGLVVVLFLLRPFLRQTDPNFETEEQIESLLAQKEALVQDLRSLDNDMEAGKVASELYAHDRPLLMRRAALVLQQLDRLGYHEAAEATVLPTSPGASDLTLDDQIEAAVLRLRNPAQSDAAIEAAVLALRHPTASAGSVDTIPNTIPHCPQCGQTVDADDRFCANCGHSLTAESAIAGPA